MFDVKLKIDKVTKGAIRYAEESHADGRVIFPVIYFRKAALPATPPTRIRVQVAGLDG